MTRTTLYTADVVIAGAGAAGLICARQAAQRGKSVILIDHAKRPGTKILLSGGGKSNFTNRKCRAEHFISQNKHFCKSALAQWTAQDFLAWLEGQGIDYEERQLGRLFCLDSAQTLVNALVRECQHAGVTFCMERKIQAVQKNQTPFVIQTEQETFQAAALVVATGGLSYPQAGATGWGHQVAEQFGLAVVPCRPGLTPLLFSRQDEQYLKALTGISVDAAVECRGKRFDENVLFTHFGLSGPAILQISNYWQPGEVIHIDWVPKFDVYDYLVHTKQRKGNLTPEKALETLLPARMTRLWGEHYFVRKALAECSLGQLQQAADALKAWPFIPRGTDGYNKAEVTLVGVSTDELSSKTMESRQVKGLYFVGEVLDVTGQLGGYNLQWAWSSGYAAGIHL